MKRNFKKMVMVVITMVGMIMVSGCWRNNDITKVKKIENVNHAVEFEYKGHEYIMFMKLVQILLI